MESEYGYTLDELITELENVRLNFGGDIEVMLPQITDEEDGSETHWNAHICEVEVDENDLGETIVKIF